MLFMETLIVVGLHELQVLRRAIRSPVKDAVALSGQQQQSGVVSFETTDGLQPAACNWADCIQGKCEQQYICLGIFEIVCALGYNET